jgi:hypothetical protein
MTGPGRRVEDAAAAADGPHTLGTVETDPLNLPRPATAGPVDEVPADEVVAVEPAVVEIPAEPADDHDRATLEGLEAELAVLEAELARVDADGVDVAGTGVGETR